MMRHIVVIDNLVLVQAPQPDYLVKAACSNNLIFDSEALFETWFETDTCDYIWEGKNMERLLYLLAHGVPYDHFLVVGRCDQKVMVVLTPTQIDDIFGMTTQHSERVLSEKM